MDYQTAKHFAENQPKHKAIAAADETASTAGLPTYSELAHALRWAERCVSAPGPHMDPHACAEKIRAMMARLPK